MIRHLLLAASKPSTPVGPLPPDPTLTEPRHITSVIGVNQNVTTPNSSRTWRTRWRAATDLNGLTLAYGSFAQAILAEPWTAAVTLEMPDGTLLPVTFGGQEYLSCGEAQSVESDPIDVQIGEGEVFYLRTLQPGGIQAPVNGATYTFMDGDHRSDEEWVPAEDLNGGLESPVPVAIIGATRQGVVCPAMIGDSICGMGIAPAGWWRLALGARPGLSYGRNARRFTDLDGREGNTLRAATHVLVQYSVNDLSNAPPVSTLWANALDCYAYVDDLKPNVGIWQTTTTPMVSTTDECATLDGQTPYSAAARQAWVAFLRDGAPIDPATKAALAPGASGLRAGQFGHPLRGIVDVAAAVEQGGAVAPTGKWRVDLGPLGGDGVHPSNLGMSIMAGPVATWLNGLA